MNSLIISQQGGLRRSCVPVHRDCRKHSGYEMQVLLLNNIFFNGMNLEVQKKIVLINLIGKTWSILNLVGPQYSKRLIHRGNKGLRLDSYKRIFYEL